MGPRFSGVTSLDGINDDDQDMMDTLEYSTQVEDFQYYCRLFLNQVIPIFDFAAPIFEMMSAAYSLQYHALNEEFGVPNGNHIDFSVIRILDEMGLNPRKDLGFRPYGLEMIEDVFPSDYFSSFDRYDNLFGFYSEKRLSNTASQETILGFMDNQRFLRVHSFWRAYFEIQSLMRISSNNNARILMPNSDEVPISFELSPDDDKLQLFRLYIREVNTIPRIETFSDLFRLYNHKYVSRFREVLDEWSTLLRNGEIDPLKRMEKDFELAIRDLSTVAKMQRVGDILTVVGLPVAIGGLLTGLPLDFGFAAVGPAILLATDRMEKRSEWVRFGSL